MNPTLQWGLVESSWISEQILGAVLADLRFQAACAAKEPVVDAASISLGLGGALAPGSENSTVLPPSQLQCHDSGVLNFHLGIIMIAIVVSCKLKSGVEMISKSGHIEVDATTAHYCQRQRWQFGWCWKRDQISFLFCFDTTLQRNSKPGSPA